MDNFLRIMLDYLLQEKVIQLEEEDLTQKINLIRAQTRDN